jgi:hypothetical protein
VNSWPVLFGRFCHLLTGYIFAVLAAVIITMAAYLAPSALPDAGAWGSIHANLRDWQTMFLVGLMLTFPAALPGFLIAVFFSIFQRWRSRLPFIIAGSANALFSWLLLAAYALSFSIIQPDLLAASLIGGLAGGFAYWATTGRVTAGWRLAQ